MFDQTDENQSDTGSGSSSGSSGGQSTDDGSSGSQKQESTQQPALELPDGHQIVSPPASAVEQLPAGVVVTKPAPPAEGADTPDDTLSVHVPVDGTWHRIEVSGERLWNEIVADVEAFLAKL